MPPLLKVDFLLLRIWLADDLFDLSFDWLLLWEKEGRRLVRDGREKMRRTRELLLWILGDGERIGEPESADSRLISALSCWLRVGEVEDLLCERIWQRGDGVQR